ncbi:MAG: apolipoprotein N-acyltransferase [Chitinophagales bacterium]
MNVLFFILMLISAVLGFLAWPDINFFPLIFVAWIPLFMLEDIARNKNYSLKKVFLFLYLQFLLWNVLTTWWVKNASLAGGILAFVFNSLFMTLPWLLFAYMRRKYTPLTSYIALLCFWMAFEYIHLNWELTWPWLTLGNVFAGFPQIVQWYSYTGVGGGTFWVILVNIVLFRQIQKIQTYNWHEARNIVQLLRKVLPHSLLALGLFVVPIVISLIIYSNYTEKGEVVECIVLQPNIDPYNEKFNDAYADEQLSRFIALSLSEISPQTRYVFWPETSLPGYVWKQQFWQTSSIKKIVTAFKDYSQVQLIIGATVLNLYPKDEARTATARPLNKFDVANSDWYDVYNAAIGLDSTQHFQLYIKSRLVPGVERMPYPQLFRFLENFAIDLGGISGSMGVQDEADVITFGNNAVAPVICYESVFGEYVTEYVRKGANIIAIITNDGWWGNTPGHRQHLRYASLRALETRRDIARSANTGISAFINQRGDIRQATTYETEAVIKDTVHANTELTFYVRYGDYLYRLALLGAIFFLLRLIIRRFSKRFKPALFEHRY